MTKKVECPNCLRGKVIAGLYADGWYAHCLDCQWRDAGPGTGMAQAMDVANGFAQEDDHMTRYLEGCL